MSDDSLRARQQARFRRERGRYIQQCFESMLFDDSAGRIWIKVIIACEEITEIHVEALNDIIATKVREGDTWKFTWLWR